MKRHADSKTMIHISDADIFGALKLEGGALGGVRAAVDAEDYRTAWQAMADYFAARKDPKPAVDSAKAARKLDPEGDQARSIIGAADKLVRHEITGWHSTTFQFGKTIDFNAEFGQSGVYGFHYMGWLSPIGQAYVITGDAQYAAAFDDIFSQWYDQRDRVQFRIPHLDPIWYELGCGCRTPGLISLYEVFRGAPELRAQTVAKLWKTFLGHGRWLLRHETQGYRNANWQVTGCRALFVLGLSFPEFRESGEWMRLGKRRLMQHCERDFFEDGCYSERCPGYGTIGLRFVPELYELLGRTKGHAADRRKLKQRMEGAYRWYMLTSTPLRTSPATGDSGYVPIAALMKEGARRTGDGTLLWPIRDMLTEEERGQSPRPVRPAVTSVHLPSSGFAVMRTGWEREDLYMMINHGPFGGGHTHNHTLDFELFAFGDGLALDSSRFDSYDNPLDAYFRSARAHNQVVVNDANMDRVGLKVTDLIWQPGRRGDLFAATHDGYEKSHNVRITRKIVFVKPHYWFISDLIEERKRHHSYTWFLQSPHRLRARAGKAFVAGSGPGLLVLPARPGEIRHVRTGTGYTGSDWRTVGAFPDRHWIGYQKFSHTADFATYGALLHPFSRNVPSAGIEPLTVTADGEEVGRREAEAFLVRVDDREHIIAFSHGEPVQRRYGPVRCKCRMALFEKRTNRWHRVAAV